MGWLGWTEKEALETDVNAIMVAMEGKLEMLNPKLAKRPKATFAQKWREFAKGHNAVMKAKKNGGQRSARPAGNGKGRG